MSALEEIESAIEKLSRLKADSGTCEEWLGGDFQSVKFLDSKTLNLGGHLAVDIWAGSEQTPSGEWHNSSAIELVRILHRTIDAQLAILESARTDLAAWLDPDSEYGWEPQDGPIPRGSSFAAKFALARAINGTVS